MNNTFIDSKVNGSILVEAYYTDDIAVLRFVRETNHKERERTEYVIRIYSHFRITDLKEKKLIVGIMAYAGLHNAQSDDYDSRLVDEHLRRLAKKDLYVSNCSISNYNDLCITFSNSQRLEVFAATFGIMKVWDCEERILS